MQGCKGQGQGFWSLAFSRFGDLECCFSGFRMISVLNVFMIFRFRAFSTFRVVCRI